MFFLHIEDGPNFYSGKLELYQLAWHVINTDYINDLIHVQKALNLPSSYLLLSSLEAGSAYFYDIDSEMVIYYSEGRDNSELGDFNSFMENYFGLG